ncbi:hypothetical protein J4416_02660 [Candidatus Pacearchaeota archaeon]|nr:hypothetical protein [Candidatus Pacearchaeota archaeon]
MGIKTAIGIGALGLLCYYGCNHFNNQYKKEIADPVYQNHRLCDEKLNGLLKDPLYPILIERINSQDPRSKEVFNLVMERHYLETNGSFEEIRESMEGNRLKSIILGSLVGLIGIGFVSVIAGNAHKSLEGSNYDITVP